MIRYRLDELGWYQFEWLVQSLLKAEISSAIESWGGRADHGIDAYYPHVLPFPLRHVPNSGPFLFQIKFIENANAAGAKADPVVINAIRKEAARIRERLDPKRAQRIFSRWATAPAHYCFYTNAPVSAALRVKIEKIIHEVLPSATVHSFGGTDICDLLEKHEGVKRSFPQLLGLRDLEELLRAAVSKESIEFSRRAIELARPICSVFVPTAAYERTWRVLKRHHFVVLEGPPEMGKTAIAWIVALSQVANGWDAIVCDEPDDFFKRLDPNRSQVFIADDAFGRTEYDPARGLKWERKLDVILNSLDPKHWLVWTSRKHILERALRAMDTQLSSKRFPDPAAILVNASQLSDQERALILYRHARAEELEDDARALVRSNARTIVKDRNFTPERIRRFVKEALPEMVSRHCGKDELLAAIREAIRNPTDRMRKSYLALPPSHKWFLVALLESGGEDLEAVTQLYDQHCPVYAKRPSSEVSEELKESFVKVGSDAVDWTHPSYRDLVIEELGKDEAMKTEFFNKMSLPGIKLAISDTGGLLGQRVRPLMSSDESWRLLLERCLVCVSEESDDDITAMLQSLSSAIARASPTDRDQLIAVIKEVCNAVYKKWNDAKSVLSSDQLSIYSAATTLVSPLPPVPDLEASWKDVDTALRSELQEPSDSFFLFWYVLEEWLRFAITIRKLEPRFLEQTGRDESIKNLIRQVLDKLQSDLNSVDTLGDYDELMSQKHGLSELRGWLLTLSTSLPDHLEKEDQREIASLRRRFSEAEGRLAAAAAEVGPPDDDDDSDYRPQSTDFDIEGLFGDL